METEIEAKFLDIDPDAIRQRLRSMHAMCIAPERLMRRKVFDFPDNRLDDVSTWVRVRDEGDKITTSIKHQDNTSLHGTKDLTVTVESFDAMCEYLTQLGLVEKSYQETKRETWRSGDVEIVIDTWPWIPSFIEIEGPSEIAVTRIAEALGFEMRESVWGGVASGVYLKYYETPEATVNQYPRIVFSDSAPWKPKKV